jgi:hypothetical protein
MEAFTLSFIAENSLPLVMAPKLIQYAKESSRDKKALDMVELERTTASYKLREGLGLVL